MNNEFGEHLKLIRISENPELISCAAKWFSDKWNIPESEYKNSMKDSLNSVSDIPEWYIVLNDFNEIVAGVGIIENDFHKREDLTPNLCALYVEPLYRNQGIAGKLLDFAREEINKFGFSIIYLLTDHTGFYEKYGWKFLNMTECNDGNYSRMYFAQCIPKFSESI